MDAVIVDIPRGNQQFYDQIIPTLFPDGKLPEGWQVHIAGPTEASWRIVNVVPSREQFETFSRERLGPILQQLEGVTPKLTYFPVYRMIRAMS
jgi:hypothetical protein